MIAVGAMVVALLVAAPGTALGALAVPVQLNATDTALLNGVRLAGSWGIPAGRMATIGAVRAGTRNVDGVPPVSPIVVR